MIIHTTNILVAPLLLVAWAIDVYIFLACLRLLLGKLPGVGPGRASQCLQVITDPLALAVARLLHRPCAKGVPSWLPWLLVILAAIVLRYAVVGLVLRVQ
jgi:uncharacterized protein YggT (Ycf19 family)